MGLVETLREAIVYPVAEVRVCIAVLLEVTFLHVFL